jgi:predicted  nucleic acid-binding Zn-ribbon protein
MKEAQILETLVTLQKIDSDILNVDAQKIELQEKIKAFKDRIASNAAEFTSKKTRLDDSRKKRAQIEMEIKSKQTEIKNKEGQSDAIKTNAAFKALQGEIDSIKKAITACEDNIIKLMEEEESVAAWVKAQESDMKDEEAKINSGIKAVESELASKDGIIAGYRKSRDEAVANVDKVWYERYERIRKRKGLALAPINEDATGAGMCGGCKFTIRPQSIIELKKHLAIMTCENCARIWYIEEKKEEKK